MGDARDEPQRRVESLGWGNVGRQLRNERGGEGEALLGPSKASQAQGMGNWDIYPMER